MTDETKHLTLDELLAASAPKYLATDERDEMILQRTEVIVIGVSDPMAGMFGEKWEVSVRVNGQVRILSFPRNDTRDALMLGLKDLTETDGEQGPLVLKSVKTRYPNPFYYFARPHVQQTLLLGTGSEDAAQT